MTTNKRTALITGASKGLGYSLADYLAHTGWNLLIDARSADQLLGAKDHLEQFTKVVAIPGDIRDETHLLRLSEALAINQWKLDLLVNNASALGISPLRKLLEHPVDNLHVIFHTNMIAPISLLQKVKSYLKDNATIINVSSDAGAETYETWGAYGGSKAGLDHMTSILAKEYPTWRFYSFDPGDMQTEMHQAAFPGEDISDRPTPSEKAIPALIQLIENEFPSGRYTTSTLLKQQLI